jgi:hypothetical protein
VAEPGGWRGDDLVGTVRLSFIRHRLAVPTGDVAADVGGLTIFALRRQASMILSSHDIGD